MKLPTIDSLSQSRSVVDSFGGYNHNAIINENEFYDMKNMTADEYPLMTVRKNRNEYVNGFKVISNSIMVNSHECYCIKNTIGATILNIYDVNGSKHEVTFSGIYSESVGVDIKLVSMSGYLLLLCKSNASYNYYDIKKWLNTVDIVSVPIALEDIDASVNMNFCTTPRINDTSLYYRDFFEKYRYVMFLLCDKDGNVKKIKYNQSTEPTEKNNTYGVNGFTDNNLGFLSDMGLVWESDNGEAIEYNGKTYSGKGKLWQIWLGMAPYATAYKNAVKNDANKDEAIESFDYVIKSVQDYLTKLFASGKYNQFHSRIEKTITNIEKVKTYCYTYKTSSNNLENLGDNIANVYKIDLLTIKNYAVKKDIAELEDGDWWCDGETVQQWYETSSMWMPVETYVKVCWVDTNGDVKKYSVGDGITIKKIPKKIKLNITDEEYEDFLSINSHKKIKPVLAYINKSFGYDSIDTSEIYKLNGLQNIVALGDNMPITDYTDGSISTSVTKLSWMVFKLNVTHDTFLISNYSNENLGLPDSLCGTIKTERYMPRMKYIFENQNRLWGCWYGKQKLPDGTTEFVNEIYASALGDFKNWHKFSTGISTDSYAASVGSDGDWTGGISYGGYPMFFKQDMIYRVSGSYPAQYQISDLKCRGVKLGCSDSLAIVNEILCYVGVDGIISYDGSLPSKISESLGGQLLSDAVGVAYKNKYIVNATSSEDNTKHTYIYDAGKGIMVKDDDINIKGFGIAGDNLFFVKSDGYAFNFYGSNADGVEWYAETGYIGYSSPDAKYVNRMTWRLAVDKGAHIKAYIKYDNDNRWISCMTLTQTRLRSISLPVKPRRCDRFKMRLEGKGGVTIYSLTKTLEGGSDK